MPVDPDLVFDEETIEAAANATGQFLDKLEEKNEAREAAQQEAVAEETQAKAELDDPRNKENWGVAAFAKEGQSILSGGIQDTASSLTTFPERTIDALTGQMSKERKEQGFYRPDWDPFVDEEDPIETKTWWGKLLRGTVHFGSMAAGVIAAAKSAPVTVPTWAATALSTNWARAAAVGATTDLISKESDGHNALGALRSQYGFIDTPLSTKDADHPVMMKLKNILEGMGIGAAFDGAYYLIKGNAGIPKIQARNESIENMTRDKALDELRKMEVGFRAAKNNPIADPWQGSYISEQTPHEAWLALKEKRSKWGSEPGSIGRVATPVQIERVAREGDLSESMADQILRSLWSTDKYRAEIDAIRAGRKTLLEVHGDSIAAYQRIVEGRNATELSTEEFLAELYRSKDTYEVTNTAGDVVDTIEMFTSKNVVTADLLSGSLLHQIQDVGISGRELADIANLGDIDGPAAQIIDHLLVLQKEVKKARILKSANFRELGAGKQKPFLESQLTKEMADTKDALMTILKIAKDDNDPALMNALFETFSNMKEIHTMDDVLNWMRKTLKGGSLDGISPEKTGVIIRELGGVMINSILSGPKTPMRAAMGTSTATFLRPLSTAMGAAMRYPFTGDSATLRASLSALNAMYEAVPESFTLFKERLNSYWSGDIANVKSRYYEYSKSDDNWDILRKLIEDHPDSTWGDKAMFNMANIARNMNNNSFLTYSTKLMAATDDSFAYILGRAKAREKAMRSVLDIQAKGGKTPQITRELMQAYEKDFYDRIWDADGNLIDEATKFARKEVTLTQPLTGFSKGLNDVFSANPWAKPFFLFARTGVNGLSLTAKHTPGFNFLVKEFNDIAWAKPDDLSKVAKYGIETAEELANAKALQTGRLSIGSGITMMTTMKFLGGGLTGNGPIDRQKRQAWIDAGYRPRQIKLAGTWISYDSIEPFNQIFSTIADIGDYSLLMGDEWTEDQLQKVSLVVAQAISSKSYFAGMQQLVDMVAGKPGQQQRILAGIMNNQVPLAGLRNDIGKLFTPYMRELNSGIGDNLRNRNLISEYLPGDDLPIKYDLLNGKPIRDYDFLTRAYNTFSPIALNLDHSDGRKLLFDSGYDVRMSVFMSPDGIDLTDHPRLRSMFQRAIGKQNLEYRLTTLANNPKIEASLDDMYKDIRGGDRGRYDPSDYYHNMKIDAIFQEARRKAWASIMRDPRIEELRQNALQEKQAKQRKKTQTRDILSIYK